MALFNEILAGRYNRALQKMFGIKGPPSTPQLGGEIIPSVSMFYGTEARYLEGWNRIGGRVLVAAVAANISAFRLLNPSTSGVVAVIEKLLAFGTVQQQILVTIERPASVGTFPLVGSQIAFDKRGASPGGTVDGSCLIQGKNNNATTFGVTVGAPSVPANSSIDIIFTDIQEIPLLPGDSLDVSSAAVNTLVDGLIWWRERVLEDSEKT